MTKKSEGESEENEKKDEKSVKIIQEEVKDLKISDVSDEPSKLLQGFKNSKYEVKIFLLSGDIENISKKKKFKNIFDVICIGFHSKNFLSSIPNLIKNEKTDIFLETNKFLLIKFKSYDKL